MTEAGRWAWRRLSKREREVLRLLFQYGESDAALAERLDCAPTTVTHHPGQIYLKTGMENRLGLVIFAFNHGWVMPAWAGVDIA